MQSLLFSFMKTQGEKDEIRDETDVGKEMAPWHHLQAWCGFGSNTCEGMAQVSAAIPHSGSVEFISLLSAFWKLHHLHRNAHKISQVTFKVVLG